MKTFTLNDGRKIPAVGFGTYRIENEQAKSIVGKALEFGYRLIDTAAVYKNEVGIGEALSASSLPREELFVSSKIWNDDLRQGRIQEACRECLERLGLDYLDLLLVHWPAGDYHTYWKAFEDLKRKGLAKSIGVSNFTQSMLEGLLAGAEIPPAVNQVERHPLLNQRDLVKYCTKHNITVTAWSGFMLGELLEKSELVEIARHYGKTAAQVIQRWNFQNGVVTIPKTVHPERMAENIDIFDFSLTYEEVKVINGMNQNLRSGPDPDHFDF